MIGAIMGDIAGSRFERVNHKSKEFELFHKNCRPTDDSVMSLAIAKAVLECENGFDTLGEKAVSAMQELGKIYKNAGYGGTFIKWIWAEDPQPYNSYGNGSAMRIGPCGYAANSLDEAKELSDKVTRVSHNHPEGMKGAEAIAVAVYLAKSGKSMEEIRTYVLDHYYDLDFTLDQIRETYQFDVSCQGSVPIALEAFFEANSFEDAIRNAISVGGDSDTIGAMAGAVAEAYFGVPEELIADAIDYLDARQMEILYYFEKKYPSKALDEDGEASKTVFDVLDDCVDKVIPAGTTIAADGERSWGAIHGWIEDEQMQPDFSSFDKHGKDENDRLSAKVRLKMAKKELNYKSMDALVPVENLLNETTKALKDTSRVVLEGAVPEVVGGVGGGAIGAAAAGGLIYSLGKVGLGAAGITSGLKALGFGISMMTGVGVAGALVAAPAVGGYALFNYAKNKKLAQEKERLYQIALEKHEAIIEALKVEADAGRERLDYLQSLNILLQQAIRDLKKDLGHE